MTDLFYFTIGDTEYFVEIRILLLIAVVALLLNSLLLFFCVQKMRRKKKKIAKALLPDDGTALKERKPAESDGTATKIPSAVEPPEEPRESVDQQVCPYCETFNSLNALRCCACGKRIWK